MTTYTTYYTYNGYSMQQDLLCYYTIESKWTDIEEGIDTESVAKIVKTFAIKATGSVTKTLASALSFIDEGISLFQDFVDATGYSTVDGSYEDFIQAKTKYDVSTKYTYVKSGDYYLLGAVTQQIYMYWVKTSQYFYVDSTGHSNESVNYFYEYYSTPNYSSPNAKAIIYFGNPWTEYIKMTVPNTNVSITF